MTKKPYEFVDFSLGKKLEEELEERERKEIKKRFKVCLRCGERKSPFSFSVDKRNTDGRINTCKVCRAIESSKYYYQNREQILIKVKEY